MVILLKRNNKQQVSTTNFSFSQLNALSLLQSLYSDEFLFPSHF